MNAEIGRIDRVPARSARVEVVNVGRGVARHFVDAAGRMNDRPRARAQTGERVAHQFQMRLARDADDLTRRPRGIGQRTQEIEHGTHAEVAANRPDFLHGRMIALREQKRESVPLQRGRRRLRRGIDRDAGCFKNVGAAAAARGRAIAVLGHGQAATRDHESDGRGNVERVRAVAARAARIEHFVEFVLHV